MVAHTAIVKHVNLFFILRIKKLFYYHIITLPQYKQLSMKNNIYNKL